MSLPSPNTGSPKKYSGAQPLDRPRASEIPETPSHWGESRAEQAVAQVFPGPVPRPLPLDKGTLNETGKLNSSCLAPSECEAGALLTALQGDGRFAEEGHCPGPGTRQLPGVLIMFRCAGDKVSKDHGKIRMFSEVCVPPGRPVIITGCSWSSKRFRHEVPPRGRLVSCVSMDPLSLPCFKTPQARSSHLRSVHAAPLPPPTPTPASFQAPVPTGPPLFQVPPHLKALVTLPLFCEAPCLWPQPWLWVPGTVGGCSVDWRTRGPHSSPRRPGHKEGAGMVGFLVSAETG